MGSSDGKDCRGTCGMKAMSLVVWELYREFGPDRRLTHHKRDGQIPFVYARLAHTSDQGRSGGGCYVGIRNSTPARPLAV